MGTRASSHHPKGVVPPSAHMALQGQARPASGTWEGTWAQLDAVRGGRQDGRAWGHGGWVTRVTGVLGPDLAASRRDWGGRPGPGGQGEGGRPQRHPKAIGSGAGSRGLGTSSTRPRRDARRPSALSPTARPSLRGRRGPRRGELRQANISLLRRVTRAVGAEGLGAGGSRGTQKGRRGALTQPSPWCRDPIYRRIGEQTIRG